METTKIIASILAGMITVLTPCVLPFLPVILGGSLGSNRLVKPLVIILSLSVSVMLFGILFNESFRVLGLKKDTVIVFAGVIILIFGLFTLFPKVWTKLTEKFEGGGQKLLQKGGQKGGLLGAGLMGFALGPVFSGCSPTFGYILGIIAASENRGEGMFYLSLYVAGLGVLLLLIAIFGQKLVQKLGWASNPTGWFKRILGIILVVMGIVIMTGFDKTVEAWIISNGLDFFTGAEKVLGNWFNR